MKPGPAISTAAMSSPAGSASTSACASARGLVRAGLASSIAALVEKSPCAAILRALDHEVGRRQVGRHVPRSRRVSMPCWIRARRWVFTRDSADGRSDGRGDSRNGAPAPDQRARGQPAPLSAAVASDPAARASDTGAPSPMTKWSSRRTSTSASDCFRRAVTARSAALGSVLPLGWLWPTMIAAALCASARRTTSRGCTSAPSTVPRNSSSNASARWRVSRNSAAKTSCGWPRRRCGEIAAGRGGVGQRLAALQAGGQVPVASSSAADSWQARAGPMPGSCARSVALRSSSVRSGPCAASKCARGGHRVHAAQAGARGTTPAVRHPTTRRRRARAVFRGDVRERASRGCAWPQRALRRRRARHRGAVRLRVS